MHSSMIITLICNAYNYNDSELHTGGSIFQAYYILLLCVSKPHFIQDSMSMRIINHTHAWTHMCKNRGCRYFKRLCPVVISNLIAVLEYWHKYPAIKLS